MNVRTSAPLRLYDGPAPGSEGWTHEESAYFSELFMTAVVTNVVVPTLTPYLPVRGDGTAVIVAPGGGYHALSINSEGADVARWLATRGVAAFVLRYRLVPSGNDAVAELLAKTQGGAAADMDAVVPLAAADGTTAVRLVRNRAKDFGVEPDRIGIVGFSAGGNVALRVAFGPDADGRPDFVGAVYPSLRGLRPIEPPADRGPLFVAAASDDQLGLAPDAIELFQRWHAADSPAELHLYGKGGHGFGMRRQLLPVDGWIDRFGEWLALQDLRRR